MIKKIICLVSVLLIIFTFISCSSGTHAVEDAQSKEGSSMFVLVESDYLWNKYNIVYHKETKVMYAVSSNTVFTVMVDAEGKPLLYSEDLY